MKLLNEASIEFPKEAPDFLRESFPRLLQICEQTLTPKEFLPLRNNLIELLERSKGAPFKIATDGLTRKSTKSLLKVFGNIGLMPKNMEHFILSPNEEQSISEEQAIRPYIRQKEFVSKNNLTKLFAGITIIGFFGFAAACATHHAIALAGTAVILEQI